MSSLLQLDYINLLNSLKEKIKQARTKASVNINVELLKLYWEIGNIVSVQEKAKGWGAKVVVELSKDLSAEFSDMKGFSQRNLRYMRDFAHAYPELVNVPSPSILQASPAKSQNSEYQQVIILQESLAKLSWYHHTTLLDKVKDKDTRLFYIQQTIQNDWNRDVMVHQIEGGLHNRVGKISNNFKNTLPPEQSELVQQLFKDPYKFEFIYLAKEAKERDLENALVNQLTKFLLELGQHFAFMGRQYKLMLGEREYFFDLLFYHTRLKRYIVIDLKIDEFKPEYKGKMEFYLNLADEHLKQADDEKSIGLILCKTKDGLVVEYALRDSSKPIGIAEYKISEILPDNIKGELPSIEELEAEIEKEYEELKSPSQKKFEALKEKLSKIKGEDMKQTVTTEILFEIVDKSLMPLYIAIIKRMEDFKEMFVSSEYFWQGKNMQYRDVKNNPLSFAEKWKNEEFKYGSTNFHFMYHLNGFKRAATEAFNTGFQLDYKVDTYWYGFVIINYNNQQPFIKKLYHEQLTSKEIENIVDIVYAIIIEGIERRIENIK